MQEKQINNEKELKSLLFDYEGSNIDITLIEKCINNGVNLNCEVNYEVGYNSFLTPFICGEIRFASPKSAENGFDVVRLLIDRGAKIAETEQKSLERIRRRTLKIIEINNLNFQLMLLQYIDEESMRKGYTSFDSSLSNQINSTLNIAIKWAEINEVAMRCASSLISIGAKLSCNSAYGTNKNQKIDPLSSCWYFMDLGKEKQSLLMQKLYEYSERKYKPLIDKLPMMKILESSCNVIRHIKKETVERMQALILYQYYSNEQILSFVLCLKQKEKAWTKIPKVIKQLIIEFVNITLLNDKILDVINSLEEKSNTNLQLGAQNL